MRERVFITGIGCISSFGLGVQPFMDALFAGRTGIVPVQTFDTSRCRAHRAALVQDFDPAASIPPLKLRRMDDVSRLALVSAKATFEDAGWPVGEGQSHDRVGIAFGTYTAGLDSMVEYLRGLIKNGPAGVPALLFSNTVSNAPASLCAIELGLRGPNVTFNQREASGLSALAYAAAAVADARADAMLTGAGDKIVETFFKAHDLFHALSPRRSSEPEIARPFDRRRNGYVLGEGCFTLLLESERSAAARNVRVYGEVVGIGATGSRAGINEWPADPAGLCRAMTDACSQARVAAHDAVAVFGAADGSPDLDRMESTAINTAWGGRRIPVVSLKGAIGESSSGGIASIVAGLVGIAAGRLPPTVGWAEHDALCDVEVSAAARDCPAGVFLVNSVASGGANYSVAIRAMAQ
jgi:3-oxoacyl-[acyl-carrier-protein] synthase II